MTEDQAFQKLGLCRTSQLKEVTAAYRKLALTYHPDAVSGSNEFVQAYARRQMMEINVAYDVARQTAADRRPSNESSPGSGFNGANRSPVDAATSEAETGPAITFACSNCQRRMKVPYSLRGRQGTCSACKTELTVPQYRVVVCRECRRKSKLPFKLESKSPVCWNCLADL